jgi:hypothetical protein
MKNLNSAISWTARLASSELADGEISLSFNNATLFLMIFCSVYMADILLAALPRSLSNVRSS